MKHLIHLQNALQQRATIEQSASPHIDDAKQLPWIGTAAEVYFDHPQKEGYQRQRIARQRRTVRRR